VVGGIADVHVAVQVYRHADRCGKTGFRGRAPIATKIKVPPSPGHCSDDAGGRIHAPDAIVAVTNKQVAACVESQAIRKKAEGASGNRRDDPGSHVYAPDTLIPSVSYEEIAVSVEGYAAWAVYAGAGGGASVAAKAFCAVPSYRVDDARLRIHAPDAIVAEVGDKYVASDIYCYIGWGVQAGFKSGPTVTTKAREVASCQGDNDPRTRIYAPDALIVGVGAEEIASFVQRY
jgi:hypothetical protein